MSLGGGDDDDRSNVFPTVAAADDDYADYPENHALAEALVPKFAAAFSLFGSSMIIYELYLDHRQGNTRDGATLRILLSMSIADIIFSIAYFLTTWPAPSDLVYIRFNAGNQATCTFQGFLIQLGYVASPLFNIMLALFFLLRIRYRWTDHRLRRLEPWVQGSIWAFALASAIYPIPLGLYNNAWDVCWLESYPMDCLDSYRYGDEGDCTRGDNAWIHALVFQIFPPWVCVFCALIFMGMIYCTVRKVERRNTRYAARFSLAVDDSRSNNNASSFVAKSRLSSVMASLRSSVPRNTNITSAVVDQQQGTNNNGLQDETITTRRHSKRQQQPKANRQRSHKVATQAMWYIAAFLASYTLDFIAEVLWHVNDLWWFWLDIFAYFLLPLQGFFNFCVFIRTRKMKSRLGRAVRKVLCCLEGKKPCWRSSCFQKWCCFCCNRCRKKDDDDNNAAITGNKHGRHECPPTSSNNTARCSTGQSKVSFAPPLEQAAGPTTTMTTTPRFDNNVNVSMVDQPETEKEADTNVNDHDDGGNNHSNNNNQAQAQATTTTNADDDDKNKNNGEESLERTSIAPLDERHLIEV